MISPAHLHLPSLKHSILCVTSNLDKFDWNSAVTLFAAFAAAKCDGTHHKHLQIIGVDLNYIDSS